MATGLANRFNILQQSPHDFGPSQPVPAIVGEVDSEVFKWVPSHYNVRALTEDGQLILWNTFSGAMSVFPPDQAARLRELLRKPGFEARAEGLVKYLADRGFLIKEDTDELRRIRLAFGQQHYRNHTLQLILLASEDCNFRCEYCYEKFLRGTMEPWVRDGIKKLVQKRSSTLRDLHVSWFGGEPLYGLQAIEDLAPFFLQVVEENSLKYFGSMTTNGYLLTPEVADKLLAWRIRSYQITVDGMPEDHNRNRPTRDGQGTFSVILENLKALHARADDFSVTFRINFDNRNQVNMREFFGLLEQELGCDPRFKLDLHAVGRWGGENDANLDVCGFDESAIVKKQLEYEARKRGLNVGRGLKDVNRFGHEVCYAARPYNFIIGASGKVMKCTVALDMEDYNVIGKITVDGDLDLDQDKLALWTEPAFEGDKKCQKCVVLPMCQGIHCPMVRIEQDRSPCTPVRGHLKAELLETHEIMKGKARIKSVEASGAFTSST